MKSRAFAGERNPDGSRTLWFSPDAEAECTCEAKPDEPHARLCQQAPTVREYAPRNPPFARSVAEHLQDIARTLPLTDVAERVEEANDAFRRRQLNGRFNSLGRKLLAHNERRTNG